MWLLLARSASPRLFQLKIDFTVSAIKSNTIAAVLSGAPLNYFGSQHFVVSGMVDRGAGVARYFTMSTMEFFSISLLKSN